MTARLSRASRAVGCLLGGAVGDALGAPVEFMSISEIQREFGLRGILTAERDSSGLALITDDTQMTMFTAEGLLRMRTLDRAREESTIHDGCMKHSSMHRVLEAYHRWLVTQGYHPDTGESTIYSSMDASSVEQILSDGSLVHLPRLNVQRAPGNTCLSSLMTGRLMLPEQPTNNSKGCGGVMRAAPAGIIAADPGSAFWLGCRLAALTHGHATGFIAAGALAAIVNHLMEGRTLRWAVDEAIVACRKEGPVVAAGAHGPEPGEETAALLEQAVKLSEDVDPPTPRVVESLGAGWVAEEALAIGVYAALKEVHDLPAALRLAVNHSGDSDSTGSICGNVLGAARGAGAMPGPFCNRLELKPEIRRLAFALNDGRGLTA